MKYFLYPDPRIQARYELVAQVRSGECTPDQAEQRARDIGLGSLLSDLGADRDPLDEIEWSIPMVLAWIRWREKEKVTLFWKKWAEHHYSWHNEDGRWDIRELPVYGFGDLKYGPGNDERELDAATTHCSPADIAWNALRKHSLAAELTGFHLAHDGRKALLDKVIWLNAQPAQENSDLVSSNNSNEIIARDVTVLVQEAVRVWPAATNETGPLSGVGVVTQRPLIVLAIKANPALLDLSPAIRRNFAIWEAAKKLGGPSWDSREVDEKTIRRAIGEYKELVGR